MGCQSRLLPQDEAQAMSARGTSGGISEVLTHIADDVDRTAPVLVREGDPYEIPSALQQRRSREEERRLGDVRTEARRVDSRRRSWEEAQGGRDDRDGGPGRQEVAPEYS